MKIMTINVGKQFLKVIGNLITKIKLMKLMIHMEIIIVLVLILVF